MNKPVRVTIGVYLVAYAILLLLIANECRSQTLRIIPDCCDQAIRLQLENNQLRVRLDSSTARADTIKAVALRVIEAKDKRIQSLQWASNVRLSEITSQRDSETTRANNEALRAEKAEREIPKTRIGRIWKTVKLKVFAPMGIVGALYLGLNALVP